MGYDMRAMSIPPSLSKRLIEACCTGQSHVNAPDLDNIRHELSMELETEATSFSPLVDADQPRERLFNKLVFGNIYRVLCAKTQSGKYFGQTQTISYKEYILRKILPSWNETYPGRGLITGLDHYRPENEKHLYILYLYVNPLKVIYTRTDLLTPNHHRYLVWLTSRMPAPPSLLRSRDLFKEKGIFG